MRITAEMLDDIKWIQRVLQTMGDDFDKQSVNEVLNQTKEFIKGVLFERERVAKLNKK